MIAIQIIAAWLVIAGIRAAGRAALLYWSGDFTPRDFTTWAVIFYGGER